MNNLKVVLIVVCLVVGGAEVVDDVDDIVDNLVVEGAKDVWTLFEDSKFGTILGSFCTLFFLTRTILGAEKISEKERGVGVTWRYCLLSTSLYKCSFDEDCTWSP